MLVRRRATPLAIPARRIYCRAGVGLVTGRSGDFNFAEYGGELGWKATDRITISAVVFGLAGKGVGHHVQAGFKLGWALGVL